VARWRAEGTGPRFVKRGGRILYLEQDLEAWQADRLTNLAAAKAWGLG
jgi:hypothetical protein